MKPNFIKTLVLFALLGTIMIFFSGCLGNTSSTQPASDSSSSGTVKAKKTTAVYYDFEDVLVPLELSVVKGRTMIVSTPGFTSGVLTLKGRVARRSLFNFFNTNMARDNWEAVSQIKSPGTTIMVFQKASRITVITIRDEQIYTYVEIGVAPTVNAAAPVNGSTMKESSLME